MKLSDKIRIEKYQPHIMVKHTQTIRRQQPTNCLSVLDHFVGLALKELIAGLGFPPFSIIMKLHLEVKVI